MDLKQFGIEIGLDVLHNRLVKCIQKSRPKNDNDIMDNIKQPELEQQINELQLHSQNTNKTKAEYESLVSNPTSD